MPRAKKDPQEALSKIVRKDGVGEDQAIQDLHTISTASNLEAVEIAMALQQIIRGQDSLLANQTSMGEEIARIKQHMAEVDEATEKYNTDQKKFIEDVLSQAESLKVSGDAKDKLIANAAQTTAKAMAEARANIVNDRLKFEEDLSKMPKVTIVSAGVPEIVNINGHMEMRVFPEEIRIKHKVWRLPPGQPVSVPEIVSKAIEQRRKSQQETYERQAAMQKNLEQGELEHEMQRINTKYGSNGGIVVDTE